MDKQFILVLLCLMILVIALILVLKPNGATTESFRRFISPKSHSRKEGFLATPNGAFVAPETGAIRGLGLYTDGKVRMDVDDIPKKVNANGFVSDGSLSLGVSVGEGFDKSYQNQQDIYAIDTKNPDGVHSISDLHDISKKIAESPNNSHSNLFTRAGSKPTKLILAPTEVRAVIDEKYLPERDRNHQISVVGTVVPVQGYELDTNNIGEELIDTHFSNISRNKKHVRIPTAAGAVVGLDKKTRIGAGEDVETPTSDAVKSQVSVTNDGNQVMIADSLSGNTVVTPLEQSITGEQFKYMRGNVRV